MNVAYLYPWDVVGDPSAPGRLADLGVQTVALAAMYHSTRAATPYHPAHRVLDVPHPAFYLPIRPSSWSRLVPASPTWTPADAYLQARDALKAVGLQVHAWTVLTHNSHLGSANPDLVVRNAFGDPYPYALCPAHEDVIEYCERLVKEILEVGEPDGLILEACGPMGFGHQTVHEKTSGADWTPTDIDLLSLCFCTNCAPLYQSRPEPPSAPPSTAPPQRPPPALSTPPAPSKRHSVTSPTRYAPFEQPRRRPSASASSPSPETPPPTSPSRCTPTRTPGPRAPSPHSPRANREQTSWWPTAGATRPRTPPAWPGSRTCPPLTSESAPTSWPSRPAPPTRRSWRTSSGPTPRPAQRNSTFTTQA